MMIMDLANGEIKKPNLSYLSGFIGQESAIKKVKFFAQSNSNDTPFPTLLLTGSHGLGKTFLAEKIAKSLGRDFISVNCGSLKKKKDFIANVILKISGPTTIFLDESHGLSNEITTILLSLLNPTNLNSNTLSYNGLSIVYNMKLINIIFATTDAHMMFKPLKNRCFQVYFSPYKKRELIDILNHYLKNVKLSCNTNDISDACRSRARDAFLLAQNIKRYASMNNTKSIYDKDWQNIKDIFEIYPKGLSKEEVNLLEVIRNSGPMSCSNLALRLMVNEDNIKSELEVRLRELGLIENTTKGRKITNSGIDYFEL